MDTKELNNQTVIILQKLCEIAKSAGIDRLSIDNNLIRGMTEDMNLGIFILEPNSFSKMLAFDKVGIGRVKILLARLNLMDIKNTIASFSYTGHDDNIMVKKLFFKCKRLKLEFNCCDPTHIKSPIKVNDTFLYSFCIKRETITLISKSMSAFKLETITFSGTEGESVMFRSNDADGDKIDHEVAPSYSVLTPENIDYDNNFFFTYNIKKLLPIFNVVMKNSADDNAEINIVISQKGYMRLKISGMHTYILANT